MSIIFLNRYAYANNNPYRYTDPTGKCSEENSGSKIACDLQDELTEIIEPIIADFLESEGIEVVPEDQRDPEGEYSYESEDNSVFGEMSEIVVLAVNAKSGKKGKGKKGGRDSSKAEKHGDKGRALTKAQNDIKKLKDKLEQTTKKTEKKKIIQRIKNIRKDAEKKRSGTNDNNRGVRK